MLGEAGSGMGVVMLDRDRLGVLLERPAGREVVGVLVVGDQLRVDVEHLEVELEVGSEGVVGERGVEIAEVGGEKGALLPQHAKGALQLGTGRQDRLRPAARDR
jgi:hypothetical protein